ncbi:MAG: sigma-70 family RNA polymerase sigma factor [Pseudomonadota bacterium]
MAIQRHDENLDALLIQTGRGDRSAFRLLYRATSSRLYAVLIRILSDEADANDALQDVYIAIWNRANQFDPSKGRAMSWMAIMTRNAGIDALRRRRPGHVGQEFCDEIEAKDPTPLEAAIAGNLAQTLATSLEQLPDRQRDALRLFYLEEQSLSEISDVMKAPLNTVKSWLRRGIASLRIEFEDMSFRELI